MPAPDTLLVFALAASVLVAIPGPNHLFIVTRSIARGRRIGLASALGVETGTLVHVSAATVGLSALVASSAMAFNAPAPVRRSGARLGVDADPRPRPRGLRHRDDERPALRAGRRRPRRVAAPPPPLARVQRYLTGCIYLALAAVATFVPAHRRRT